MTQTINCKDYTITIQRGLLTDSRRLSASLGKLGSCFAVVTNTQLLPLYGEPLAQDLCKEGLKTHLFSFPAGEQYKTRSTKESLENALFEKECGRDTCIIALGGGVVTDLVGYLASTYCRGVPLVIIPTGLLGMVDACIGGKTGVNTPYGKNLIGSIYPPKQVLIDPSILKTLPLREIRNGVVEMIKHALIADSSLFTYLETHVDSILQLEAESIDEAIFRNCQIKKEIVEQDEKEQGKRHLLNLGHTVGHALEHLSDYRLSHGEAVAIGLLVEGDIAVQLGTLTPSEWDRIYRLLKRYGLPLDLPDSISLKALLNAMILDKKSRDHKPHFVILTGIGSAMLCEGNHCTGVEESIIAQAFKRVQDALCRH